jgi:hypothetical protein
LDPIVFQFPAQQFWGVILILGIFLGAVVVFTILPRNNDKAPALITLQSRIGLANLPSPLFVFVLVLWSTLAGLLLLGLLAQIWAIMSSAIPNDIEVFEWRFALVRLTALTATFGAVVAFPFTVVRLALVSKQTITAEQGLITDRLNKAVEGLGSSRIIQLPKAEGSEQNVSMSIAQPNVEVRVGAILALDRIARDSPDDAKAVLELLSAYLNENCKGGTKDKKGIGRNFLRGDIKTAFKVSFQLAEKFDRLGNIFQRLQLDYRRLNLSHFQVLDVNFQFAMLNYFNVRNTSFHSCKFKKCHLRALDSKGVGFHSTKFNKCMFRNCKEFDKMSFRNCDFSKSAFQDVDLSKTNLTTEDLEYTFGDASVLLPDNVTPDHESWPTLWAKEVLDETAFKEEWFTFQEITRRKTPSSPPPHIQA